MPAIEAPVLVRCAGCGDWFELSARRARDKRKHGERPFCRSCRRPPPQPTENDRRYWLDRFTLDEIRELADGMFGPRED